jgi:hypothetical protein
MSLCLCARDALCDSCLGTLITQHRGVAACRGDTWAGAVARRRPRARGTPWPVYEGKAAAIARGKVADLGIDPRLIDALARICNEQAGRAWTSSAWWWQGRE